MYHTTYPGGVALSDIQRQAAELVKAFNAKGKEIETSLDVAMNAASLFVAGAAKKITPVDTSLLRNSITNRVKKIKGRTTGEVGTSNEYAAYREFGTGIYAEGGKGRKTPWFVPLEDGGFWTKGMKAANGGRGFLRVALDDSKNTVQAIITAYLKKVL